ncbi:MAG: YraN family protein [Balneolaceae bacterium]|nr:YraN family protein [Balneolaceae bacterium]
MNAKTTRQIGDEGEDLAVAYLESKGYTILDRNYYFERAEVDIVAFDETCIVFVEVKKRATADFGKPEEFVTASKIDNLYKAAEAWIYERKMDTAPARFDVIAITQQNNEAPDIKHYENAFSKR